MIFLGWIVRIVSRLSFLGQESGVCSPTETEVLVLLLAQDYADSEECQKLPKSQKMG